LSLGTLLMAAWIRDRLVDGDSVGRHAGNAALNPIEQRIAGMGRLPA
jgi:hypothetical protein